MPDITYGPDRPTEAVAVPVFSDRLWGPGIELVTDDPVSLEAYLDQIKFTGAHGEVVAVPGERVGYLVGLGDEVDVEGLRQAAGSLAGAVAKAGSVATTLHHVSIEGAAGAVAEGYLLGSYGFTRYKTSDDVSTDRPDLHLITEDDLSNEVGRAAISAAAVGRARTMVNTPAADKSPEMIAREAVAMAAEVGATFETWDSDQITAAGFGGLAGVNAGSERPARMLRMEWAPAGASKTLVLVGKGIVFDSGGLSLKSYEFMKDMKMDMAGAAAVIGAFEAIARLEIGVRVIAITPLTENMPSGSATRPGDVLSARNGKTMEVLNTDAEGRLVLADGLSLGAESEPDLMVDLATLTGACKVALGPKIAGLFAADDGAADQVAAAARRAGERVWRMPLPDDYRVDIDSELADMKNVASHRYGGAIHAALFLREFVGETPWVHLDIAGPAWPAKVEHYQTEGASGFGVRTLIALAEDLAG